jgi:hypothetical protein
MRSVCSVAEQPRPTRHSHTRLASAPGALAPPVRLAAPDRKSSSGAAGAVGDLHLLRSVSRLEQAAMQVTPAASSRG